MRTLRLTENGVLTITEFQETLGYMIERFPDLPNFLRGSSKNESRALFELTEAMNNYKMFDVRGDYLKGLQSPNLSKLDLDSWIENTLIEHSILERVNLPFVESIISIARHETLTQAIIQAVEEEETDKSGPDLLKLQEITQEYFTDEPVSDRNIRLEGNILFVLQHFKEVVALEESGLDFILRTR